MLNSNGKNQVDCADGEQIISYLYDEINVAERAGFETHLQSCSVCAGELANFGAVRSSILEWRNKDFLIIETPVFEVQINQHNESVTSGFDIWLDKFRRILTFKPIFATVAFAVIAIFVGVVLYTLTVSQTDEIAAKTNNKSSIETNVAPTVEKIEQILKTDSSKMDSETSIAKENLLPVVRESKNTKVREELDNRKVLNNSPVKISTNNVKTVANNAANEPKIKDSIKANKKAVVVPKSQMPIYSNVEDEEDKSLRLADLFDEIDSK